MNRYLTFVTIALSAAALAGCVAATPPAPTPTVTPLPSQTAVPISEWLAEGIPEDTHIMYEQGRGLLGIHERLSIDADGTVVFSAEGLEPSGRFTGHIAADRLRDLLIEFEKNDFFALLSVNGCPTDVAHLPSGSYVVLKAGEHGDFDTLSLTIHGASNTVNDERCRLPDDGGAVKRLYQLVEAVMAVSDELVEAAQPSSEPTTAPTATRTPVPPTATSAPPIPVPIAAWLAEGIPPDTFIRYRVAAPVDFSTLVDLSADGTVQSVLEDPMSPGQMIEGTGRITQDELKALLLKFAEVDFFGLKAEGGTCIYRASHPLDPTLDQGETPYFPPVGLCVTLHGTGKAILYNPGLTVPCDPALLSTEASPLGRGGALAELEDMIREIGERVARETRSAGLESTATPEPTPTATPVPGAPEPLNQTEALSLMYGDAVTCEAVAEDAPPRCQRLWPEALTAPRFKGIFSTDLLTTRVVLGVRYRQQGVDRYLVFTSNNEDANTCHVCAPVLDGAVLSWIGGRWTLTSLTQGVLHAGVWGDPPYQAAGLRVGPEKQGALFRVGDYGHGVLSEAAYIVAPVGDELRTVLALALSEDNHNDCCNEDGYPCFKYDSTLEIQPGENPDYYDLKVTWRGTTLELPAEEGDPFITLVDEIAFYRFVEGKYRRE